MLPPEPLQRLTAVNNGAARRAGRAFCAGPRTERCLRGGSGDTRCEKAAGYATLRPGGDLSQMPDLRRR
ncbi:MAG: hypothetical protein OHK0044_08930 [Burkholderiaceae bacterium]